MGDKEDKINMESPTPTARPGATSIEPVETLSTTQLLTMMVSMQQSLTNFQLSMAEEKAERKAQIARELDLKEQMIKIEEQKLRDMELRREQAEKDAAALAKFQEEQITAQEKLQVDRHAAEQKLHEEKEKAAMVKEAARLKEEHLKAIPNMVPMTRQSDLLEYLTLFETTQVKKERKENTWAIHLLPLLNDKFRTVAMNMQSEEREQYKTLKEKLMEAEDTNLKNAAQSFWTLPKDRGTSIRDYASKLLRLLKRFAEDPDPQQVLQKVLRERVIQILPKEAKAFVRNREPQTVSVACSLAEQYFSNDERDLTSWDSRTSDDSQYYKKQYHDRGRQYNSKWQNGQRKNPEQSEPRTSPSPGTPPEQTYWKQGRGQQQKQSGGQRWGGGRDRRGDHPKDSKEQKDNKETSEKVVCQLCRGYGHTAPDCPKQVNRMSDLTSTKSPGLPLRAGIVAGKGATDVLLDSGATFSMVARDMLGKDYKKTGAVQIKGVGGDPVKYHTTNIPVTVGSHTFTLRAAVADREHITYSIIIGHNLPGLELEDLIAGTRTSETKQEKDLLLEEPICSNQFTPREATPSELSTVVDQPDQGTVNQITPTLMQRTDYSVDRDSPDPESPLIMDVTRPVSPSSDDTNSPSSLTLSLTEPDVDRPQLVNVIQTRAMTMRSKAQEEEDNRVTEEGEAQITPWDNIPTDPVPEEGTAPDKRVSETPLTEAVTNQTEFIKDQREDPTLEHLFTQARDNPDHPYAIVNGVLIRKDRDQMGETQNLILVPQRHRRHVYEEAHCSPLAGHFGFKKVKAKIERNFYWPGMCRDLKEWTKSCSTCQKGNKTKTTKAPLIPLPVISTPWTRIAFDVVGPLPRSRNGYKYILSCIDFGSRFPEAIPLRRVDAVTVANAMLTIFSRYGIPAEVLTDNGSCFVAKLTQQLFSTLGVKAIHISPYHPQTNGMLERWHRVMKTVITKSGDYKQWDKLLPLALFACRDAPHTATGLSPFEVMYGWHTRGPTSILKELWMSPKKAPLSVVQYLQKLRERVQLATETVKEMDTKAKQAAKTYYDKSARDDPLEPGDEVLVLHPAGPRGLSAQWMGPYLVEDAISPVSYKIGTPGKKGAILHRNHLKRFVQDNHVNIVVLAEEDIEDGQHLELVNPLDQGTEDRPTGQQLTVEQEVQLNQLLERYRDIFSDIPGRTSHLTFEINTGDNQPTKVRPYRIPTRWKEKLEAEVEQLLNLGIIRPSTSPWCAPVVCVRKPGGEIRMCVDYRILNSCTLNDLYPMPRVDEIIDTISPAKFITTLDLAKGYYQVPLAESSTCKTAFVTPQGKFEFTVLPFGLKNAPAGFQRLMDSVLEGEKSALAYIDDVVIHSETWSQHLEDLAMTLRRLQEAGLTVKKRKCCFAGATVSFLGHVVGKSEVRPQDAKITAIKTYQLPKTKKDLRAFLGLVGYYRKFIPNFSSRSANLTDLTKGNNPTKILMVPLHIAEFQDLKEAITSDSVLAAFQPGLPTQLHTDASDRGIGGCLVQIHPDGQERPVAFYSRKMYPRECRYTVTEKECLAAVDSVRHFQAYLLGAPFQLVTDHKALTSLQHMTGGGARVTRWALSLQPFTYQVVHRQGARHQDADGLSRQSWIEVQQQETSDRIPLQQRAPIMEGEVLGPS